jgi:anti-anti-sigma factor
MVEDELPTSSRWVGGSATGRAQTPRPGTRVVRLSGEIDLGNVASLGAWLQRQDAAEVVLDLSEVTHLAACGARVLAAFGADRSGRGVGVRIVEPANPVVGYVLSLFVSGRLRG